MYAQHQQPHNGGSMQQRYGSQAGGGSYSGMDNGGGQQNYGRPSDAYGSGDGQSGSAGQWSQGGQYGGDYGGDYGGQGADQYSLRGGQSAGQFGPSGGQSGQYGAQSGPFGRSGQEGPWGQSGQMGQMGQMGQSGQFGQSGESGQSGQSGQWSGSGSAGWQQQQPQFQGERGQRSDVSFNQRTMDKDYNLISVLYHALQGMETCQRYRQDAQREGSPEVAQFLEQVMQQEQHIAQRAKELLFRQRQI